MNESLDYSEVDQFTEIADIEPFRSVIEELRFGISSYWEIAGIILSKSGVTLKPPDDSMFSISRNFFSLLFLYSFYRGGIPERRRKLYAGILQCLRGMVTGCDNLLDDEYKKCLDTDLPDNGVRFRSVMDIMVSDRVLFKLLFDSYRRGEISIDQVLPAATASMATMTRSGIQEASEESGIRAVLKPDDIISSVHHYKTGILFRCPWDIPLAIGDVSESDVAGLLDGLYRIGMGCQIMDDMVDMAADLCNGKSNIMVSLIHHGTQKAEKRRLSAFRKSAEQKTAQKNLLYNEDLGNSSVDRSEKTCSSSDAFLVDFPVSVSEASNLARSFLNSGLRELFASEHSFFVEPAIGFLEKRIGVKLAG